MVDFLSHIFPRMFSGIAAFLVFLTITCFSLTHPKTPLYRTYRRVQKLWGVAFLQWAIHLAIILAFKLRDTNFYASNVLHLNSYFITLALIGTGAIVLLSPHNKEKNIRFLKRRATIIISFCLISLSTILIARERTTELIFISALSALFTAELLYLSTLFIKSYRATIRTLDNYYAEDAKSIIDWLKNTIIAVTVVTLVAPLSLYAPEWYISAYSLVGVPWLLYLLISFINYKNYIDMLSNATPTATIAEEEVQVEECTELQNTEKRDKLLKLIEMWVARNGYTEGNLSIIDFSKRLGTNRTYMTQLINTEYGMTYREWIAQLRVEYAKTLLTRKNAPNVTEISTLAGFSSPSYFTKVFTDFTGVSPRKWQEDFYLNKRELKP